MTFDRWLYKEFGEIQPYEFGNISGMNTWIEQMRKAFEAGHSSGLDINAGKLEKLQQEWDSAFP